MVRISRKISIVLLSIYHVIMILLLIILPLIQYEFQVPNRIGTTAGIRDFGFSGNYLFSTEGSNGLCVYDISNPLVPTYINKDTTPNTASGIVISGSYAYIVDGSTLKIFNISNPYSLNYLGQASLSGTGKNIVINGNFVFIAADLNGLDIINVTDPANPSFVNNIAVPNRANEVKILGNHLYISCYGGGLRIYEISDPINPTEVGSWTQTPCVYSTAIKDSIAYVGNTNGLTILDVSIPGAPQVISEINMIYSIKMEIKDNILIVLAGGLVLIDVMNPYFPVKIAYSQSGTFDNFKAYNHRLYIGSGLFPVLYVLDILPFQILRILFPIIMIISLITVNGLLIYKYKFRKKPKILAEKLKSEKKEKDELIKLDEGKYSQVKNEPNIYRGGIIKGGEYIFKVKVENDTDYNITDVNVKILSYPKESLNLLGDEIRIISKIEKGGFISPSFSFRPNIDCIQGNIHSLVTYIDEVNQPHIINVKPHEIKMVCGLLKPKKVDISKFRKVAIDLLNFEKTGEDIQFPYNVNLLFEKLKVLLPEQNFEIITEPEEKLVNNRFIGTFLGFAEGKYSKKEVGIKITLTGSINEENCVGKIEGFCEEPAMLIPLINEFSQLMEEKIDEPLDCTRVLRLVRKKEVPWTNIEELISEFNWDASHAQKVLDSLVEQKILTRKIKTYEKGIRYYFPGLIKD